MKITVDFAELSNYLSYSSTILSDKSVEDKLKNIIFLVNKDDVVLVSYNVFTFARTRLENSTIEGVEEGKEWAFQLKAAELNKLVQSFSSLYKTKVNLVDFEEDGVRIKITVHEEAKEEADSRLNQDSIYHMETAPIISKISDEIHMKFPEEYDATTSGDVLLYLDSLYNIVTNDTANSISSKINFAEDYVFVISSAMSAFMVNKLPDAFKNISLAYSSISFLKKMVERADIGVCKTDKYLCIVEGNTEAFMKYQKVKVNYKMYVDKRSKDKGIVLDRLYLKDVLKRMSNVGPTGTVTIVNEEELQINNSNFQQIIPLNKFKGADGIAFNVSVPILEKAVLGRDDVFTQDIFMYFVDTARGYIVYLSDSTGAWFTNTQVTRV